MGVVDAEAGGLPGIRVIEPGTSATVESDQGYIDLRWAPVVDSPAEAQGLAYELEQAPGDAFTTPVTRYRGPDLGSVLTGFAEGSYFFRIRAFDPVDGERGAWSETVHLEVHYMPMGRVWLFLIAGGIVFSLTLGAILRGHARAKHEDPKEEVAT